jgi:type III secretion protein L
MSSKIIKGGVPDDAPSGTEKLNISSLAGDKSVLKGDVVQALSSAERIIEDARQRAGEIIGQAQAEESAIREKAHQEGYEEGLRQLTDTIAEFKQKYGQILDSAEPEMLRLSLKMAERIVGKALELDRNLLLDIIHKAIQSLKYQREIRIRIHPDDVAFLKDQKMQLYAMLGESKEIEVVEDALVGRGGCIIDTEIGTIDARLETQLKVLEKKLIRG